MTTTTKELCSYKEIKELSNNVVRRIYLNDKVYEPIAVKEGLLIPFVHDRIISYILISKDVIKQSLDLID